MDIQNLVRERVIGNIKTGRKGENGVPQKLSYFHVEEDKGTSSEMVDIFKQLYPDKPTKLKIRFTNENPFNFKFKRYVNGKAVCIGNGTKAITVGKDSKNKNTQIEVECNENCQHRQSGKCKLKGNLKFELEGINAGGVWNLTTTGGYSLSNIATELFMYKKAGISIANVPFELSLIEQESLAYGTYYSIDLKRTDIKPCLVDKKVPQLNGGFREEIKQLEASKKQEEMTAEIVEEVVEQEIQQNTLNEEKYSNYLIVKKVMPTLIKGQKFNKIIFGDSNNQEVEYVLHPKANQEIINYKEGTSINLKESTIEMDRNILCKYELIRIIHPDGSVEDVIEEELKKAV